jgi:hypothetical protein
MATYNFTSADSTLDITSTDVMGYDDRHVQFISSHLLTFHNRTPLTRVHFWEILPNEFRYKVDLVDGRVWKQELYFTGSNDIDPLIQHTSNDSFKYSEIIEHNDHRQNLINCRADHGMTDWDWKPL